MLGIEWEGGGRYLPQHCASVGAGALARKGARATQRDERREEGPGSPGLSLPVSDSMVSLTQPSLSVANPGRGSRGPDADGDPVSNCVQCKCARVRSVSLEPALALVLFRSSGRH